MKRKLYLILLFILVFSYSAYSQLNISFDNECRKRNSAILSKIMMETFGETFVSDLLESNTIMIFSWEIDRDGRVLKPKSFEKHTMPSSVDSKGNRTILFTECPVEIPNKIQKKIQKAFVLNDARFEICCNPRVNNNEKEKADAIQRYTEEKKIVIVSEFPGEFKYMYYDRKPEEKYLTKIEFLKKQISIYLQQ